MNKLIRRPVYAMPGLSAMPLPSAGMGAASRNLKYILSLSSWNNTKIHLATFLFQITMLPTCHTNEVKHDLHPIPQQSHISRNIPSNRKPTCPFLSTKTYIPTSMFFLRSFTADCMQGSKLFHLPLHKMTAVSQTIFWSTTEFFSLWSNRQ